MEIPRTESILLHNRTYKLDNSFSLWKDFSAFASDISAKLTLPLTHAYVLADSGKNGTFRQLRNLPKKLRSLEEKNDKLHGLCLYTLPKGWKPNDDWDFYFKEMFLEFDLKLLSDGFYLLLSINRSLYPDIDLSSVLPDLQAGYPFTDGERFLLDKQLAVSYVDHRLRKPHFAPKSNVCTTSLQLLEQYHFE